jgi:hypothetical protein
MSDRGDTPDQTPSSPSRRILTAGRLPIVAALAAVLLVGGLVDRAGGPASAPAVASVRPVPVAAPALALSSSWFCAGATDAHQGDRNDRGAAPGSVVIANSGLATATGVVTLVPSQGTPVRVPVSVGPDRAPP